MKQKYLCFLLFSYFPKPHQLSKMFLSLSLRGVARHEAKQSVDCFRSSTKIVPHCSSLFLIVPHCSSFLVIARHEAKQSVDYLRSPPEITFVLYLVPLLISSLRGTKQSVYCFRSSPEIVPHCSSLRGTKQSVDFLRSFPKITLLQASQGQAYLSKRHDIFYLIIQIRPVGIDTID